MKNVETKMEGKVLVIRIDTTKEFGPSASGKTTIIATTGGNKPVEGTGGGVLGLNFYRKL